MDQAVPAATREESCDVLVVGAGAAGLSAAVTAAFHGLSVIVLEKEPVFGGTTAWSGGWLWVPRNPLARRAGIKEDKDAIRTYLQAEIGNHYDSDRIEAFLEAAPRMVAFFQRHTAVRFVDGNKVPDMHGGLPGAGLGGRSVCAAPFDGRQLGPLAGSLRPPLRDMSLLGMGIASGADLGHFLNAMHSPRSFAHAARRVSRHVFDLVRYRRGTQLVNGNALAARLARSAADLAVPIRLHHRVSEILVQDGRVIGAVAMAPDGEVRVWARAGILLASGGFPHDTAREAALLPTQHWSAAPPSNTGDGLRFGEQVGGTVDTSLAAPAAWAPVSLVPHRDGSIGRYPHLLERAKPGFIAVTPGGRRFVNEADSYFDFVQALLRVTPPGQAAVCWGIADRRFVRRYGLGAAKPAPAPLRPHLRSGYLKRGRTLSALALACGIDPLALENTVAEYNSHAASGDDPAYHRGATQYNLVAGDPSQQPNPCVAPVGRGPFYAVRIVPGSLGTFAGLRTDASARVLDQTGAPIPGLYAAGTDAASIMGGFYPAGGINLGPAMTFGYIAARHAAGVTADEPDLSEDLP